MDQKAQIVFRSCLTRKPPTASVIITTFNGESDLRWNLTCLGQQTFRDFEVVICDDGSTDNSITIARQFSSSLTITYLKADNFGGPARGRNNGIAIAAGEYIAFLDVDDWWTPDKLKMSIIELQKGFDLVYHPLYRASKKKRVNSLFKRKIRTRKLTTPIERDLLANGNPIPNSSIVVRKTELIRVMPIDEDRRLIASEDFDMLIRLSRNTEKFKYLRQPLGYYNMSENSLSSGRLRVDSALRVIEKHQEYLDSIGHRTPVWAKVLFSQDRRIPSAERRALLVQVFGSRNTDNVTKLRSLFQLAKLACGKRLDKYSNC